MGKIELSGDGSGINSIGTITGAGELVLSGGSENILQTFNHRIGISDDDDELAFLTIKNSDANEVIFNQDVFVGNLEINYDASYIVGSYSDENGDIMAIKHKVKPMQAVQFHPESILSLQKDTGMRMIVNVIKELIGD
jgi:hypothetical protein